jgi:inosine-uridine nucleoside N-ribohydrolase
LAETLVALARAHAERLTLIALGPLTNLALSASMPMACGGPAAWS